VGRVDAGEEGAFNVEEIGEGAADVEERETLTIKGIL